MFGSASIPSMSGATQAFSSHPDHFSFGMLPSAIHFVSLIVASAVSTLMPSMASGSDSFQGFLSVSDHIPHSNPSLGSFPFTSQNQGFNPFIRGQSSNAFSC